MTRIAQIENGLVVSTIALKEAFPSTSFPNMGPDLEFLKDNGYLPIAPLPEINTATHRLNEIPFTVFGDEVRTFEIVELPKEDKILAVTQMFKAGVQMRLDRFARTRNYDSILSACTYATDTNQNFAGDGQYCVLKRGETWTKMFEIIDEIQNDIRPIPSSFFDIESELPALEWPV